MKSDTYITSLDGARIGLTITSPPPDEHRERAAILVHGISTDRHEGGLYDQIAEALAVSGYAVLAMDLRGHGLSDGHQTDFSISGAINDIVAALRYAEDFGETPPLLLGASFGGGLCLHIAQHLYDVGALLLINPRTDYRPWVDQSTLFEDGAPRVAAQARLGEPFSCERNGFQLGRCMVNELAAWTVGRIRPKGNGPLLVWHGEDDTTIPIDSTEQFFKALPETKFRRVAGAEHGFVDSVTADVESSGTERLRDTLVAQIRDEALRAL